MTTMDRAWCGTCGAPATAVAETLDPTRPTVRCQSRSTVKLVRCGRVQGTRNEGEALIASTRYLWADTTRQHHHHDPDRDPVPYCRACQELPVTIDTITPGTTTVGTSRPVHAPGR